jgi:membrane-associated phospholipid phosphatase
VAIRRSLAPYGVSDLLVQIGLWVVFGLAYEAVRGAVVHDRARAFGDSERIIDLERRTHTFFELALQHDLPSGHAIAPAFRLSYWISEFVLLVLALVYTYFRHRKTYALFRDAVLLTNSLGLLGYLFLPTAPPRLLAGYGFRNDLSGQPTPDHATGLIAFAANPYAAMPSLHVADAILIGLFLASLSRSIPIKTLWLLWPCWLSYVVIASGNHFWLDVAAGAALAAISLLISSQVRRPRTPYAYGSVTSSFLSAHARRSREGGGDTTLASQPSGATCGNGVSRRRPESLAHTVRHRQQTMTVSSGMFPEAVRRRSQLRGGL